MLLVMFRSRDLGSVGCFPHGFMGIREFACRNQRHPKHWKNWWQISNHVPREKKWKKWGKMDGMEIFRATWCQSVCVSSWLFPWHPPPSQNSTLRESDMNRSMLGAKSSSDSALDTSADMAPSKILLAHPASKNFGCWTTLLQLQRPLYLRVPNHGY